MNTNKAILPPLIVAIGLVTYRGIRSGSSKDNPVAHLPLPSQFVGAVMIFGTLSLFTGQAEKPATLVAWGLDVAILLNLWQPGTTPGAKPKTDTVNTVSPTTSTVKK